MPGRLQGQVMIVAAHGERAPGTARTEPTALTGAAVLAREFKLDDLIAVVIDRRCPTHTGAARGTQRLVALPVKLKAVDSKALSRPRLPVVIKPRGAQEIDFVVPLAGD